MKLKALLIFLSSLWVFSSSGQEVWDLQKCIATAWQNSLDISQAEANAELSQVDLNLSRLARLPSLSGNIGYNANFGRSIDPVTNTFEAQNFSSNSYSLNGGVVLYNAGRINKTIKRANSNLTASELDIESNKNTIALSIANNFLQILLAEENIRNAQERVNIAQAQLDNTQKLVDAGARPLAELYSNQAAYAQENQNLVVAQNTYDINMTNLKLIMLVEPDLDLKITAPPIDNVDKYIQDKDFQDVYVSALGILPENKAAEERIKASNLGIDIAKAAYYPSISLGFGAGTNWSSLAQEFTPTGVALQETPFVFIDDTPVKFEVLQPQFEITDQPYFDQIDNNLNYALGVSANIPIFTNGQNKAGVQRAKINQQQAEINAERTRQSIRTNVLTAVTNLKAAIAQYDATTQSLEAFQLAYENAQKQYDVGAINSLLLNTAQNNLRTTEIQHLNAKYDLVFRSILVDFYMGKPIKL